MKIGRYSLIFLLLLAFGTPSLAGASEPGEIGSGVWLFVFGLLLIAVEAITPVFGLIGLVGLILFVAGATLMAEAGLLPGGDSGGAMLLIAAAAFLMGAFLLWVVRRGLNLRRHRPRGGREELAGACGEALRDFSMKRPNDYRGHVWVQGDRWQARSDHPIYTGDMVGVVALRGLCLIVERDDTHPARGHSGRERATPHSES